MSLTVFTMLTAGRLTGVVTVASSQSSGLPGTAGASTQAVFLIGLADSAVTFA